MSFHNPRAVGIGAATLLAFVCAGCGDSTIGSVEGTVTFDGQPLKGALVTFVPKEGGRPSYGRTDEDGRYELHYSNDKDGALVGSHKVMISTERGGDEDAEDPKKRKSVKEKVPARYNKKTELTAEVESGSNTINFDLDSGGKIISEKDQLEGKTRRRRSDGCD